MTAALTGLACSRTIGFYWIMYRQTHASRLFHCFHCGESFSPLSTPLLTQSQRSCVAINRSGQQIKKAGGGREPDFLWVSADRMDHCEGRSGWRGWNKVNCVALWLRETQFLRPRAVVARCARLSRTEGFFVSHGSSPNRWNRVGGLAGPKWGRNARWSTSRWGSGNRLECWGRSPSSPAGSGGGWLLPPHPVAHFLRQGARAEPRSSARSAAGAPPPLPKARQLPCAPTGGVSSITPLHTPASFAAGVGLRRGEGSLLPLLGPGEARAPRDGRVGGKRSCGRRSDAHPPLLPGAPRSRRSGDPGRSPRPRPYRDTEGEGVLGRRPARGPPLSHRILSPRGIRHLRQPPGVPPQHPL